MTNDIELDRISCDRCYKVVYVEYINFDETDYNQIVYECFYNTADGIICKQCVGICSLCNYYKNGNYKYCSDCYINVRNTKMINNTYNDITEKLPQELINEIISVTLNK